jgi:hypothetical protein
MKGPGSFSGITPQYAGRWRREDMMHSNRYIHSSSTNSASYGPSHFTQGALSCASKGFSLTCVDIRFLRSNNLEAEIPLTNMGAVATAGINSGQLLRDCPVGVGVDAGAVRNLSHALVSRILRSLDHRAENVKILIWLDEAAPLPLSFLQECVANAVCTNSIVPFTRTSRSIVSWHNHPPRRDSSALPRCV